MNTPCAVIGSASIAAHSVFGLNSSRWIRPTMPPPAGGCPIVSLGNSLAMFAPLVMRARPAPSAKDSAPSRGEIIGRARHYRCSVALPNRCLHRRHERQTTWHGTTILSVRKNGKVIVIGDGQVSAGQTVMKPNARKVRPAWATGQRDRRVRRRDRRRLHPVRAARGQARTRQRPVDARRGRARQGLADRQISPQPGGDDDRRRQGRDA